MRIPINVTRVMGKKFGRLTVESFSGYHEFPCGDRKPKVMCQCDCGHQVEVIAPNLLNGNTSSCGCLHRELAQRKATRHGHGTAGKITPTYISWYGMLSRCRNPNTVGATHYVNRGIRACQRWHKFENFLSDMGERPIGMTLHRKDNDGPYCPVNCVWADKKTQSRVKSTTRLVRFRGRSVSLVDAAENSVVTYATLHKRLFLLGWELEDALITPSQRATR